MTEYKSIDEKAWLDFGKSLLQRPGAALGKQEEFLRICQSDKTRFWEYMDEHLLSGEGKIVGETPVAFADTLRLTENQFLFLPSNTDDQRQIWDTFKDLPRETMGRCGFWGYVVVRMIKDGRIEPQCLASERNGKTGAYMIDKALQSKDGKQRDDCVRRILRSMCNPAPRGKRIVFNDFSLGKAYWRSYWAHTMSSNKMSSDIGLSSDQILKIFEESYYGEFSEKMHSGKSYISSHNVLGGLLLYLKKAKESNTEPTGEQLGKIIDKFSYLSGWKAIEIQEPASNQKEIEAIGNAIVLDGLLLYLKKATESKTKPTGKQLEELIDKLSCLRGAIGNAIVLDGLLSSLKKATESKTKSSPKEIEDIWKAIQKEIEAISGEADEDNSGEAGQA